MAQKSQASVDELFALFKQVRTAETAASSQQPQQQHLTKAEILRRKHGIYSGAEGAKNHCCDPRCIETGVREDELFLCKTSGYVHDCAHDKRHPLVKISDDNEVQCFMTGKYLAKVYDQRVIIKTQDNGNNDHLRVRGLELYKKGDVMYDYDDYDTDLADVQYEIGYAFETAEIFLSEHDFEQEQRRMHETALRQQEKAARPVRAKNVAEALKIMKEESNKRNYTGEVPVHHEQMSASVQLTLGALSKVLQISDPATAPKKRQKTTEEEGEGEVDVDNTDDDDDSDSDGKAKGKKKKKPAKDNTTKEMLKFANGSLAIMFAKSIQQSIVAHMKASQEERQEKNMRICKQQLAHKGTSALATAMECELILAQTEKIPVPMKISPEQIRLLATKIAHAWVLLQNLMPKPPKDCQTKKIRKQHFFLGMLHWLRKGLTLDSVVVVQKEAWLDELPSFRLILDELNRRIDKYVERTQKTQKNALTYGADSVKRALMLLPSNEELFQSFSRAINQ